MRLIKARIQNYRSSIDTGEFEVEKLKTILVGPNEAGKTVILQALQQLNKPSDVSGFDVLRDYPRSLYNDISTGKVIPKDVTVVTGYFDLEPDDKKLLPLEFQNCIYKFYRNIDNSAYHSLENAPEQIHYKDVKGDLARLITHLDKQYAAANPGEETKKPSETFKIITAAWLELSLISDEKHVKLKSQLEKYFTLVEEGNEKEETRYAKLLEQINFNQKYHEVLLSAPPISGHKN
jgi:AAA15 family ATPase/GTPase